MSIHISSDISLGVTNLLVLLIGFALALIFVRLASRQLRKRGRRALQRAFNDSRTYSLLGGMLQRAAGGNAEAARDVFLTGEILFALVLVLELLGEDVSAIREHTIYQAFRYNLDIPDFRRGERLEESHVR